MKASILIPVYNEKNTLEKIVERVLEQQVEGITTKEIVLVDDGSTDGSAHIVVELAQKFPEQVVYHIQSHNQGKGAAIRKAIEIASGDVAIIQDADLEYDTNDYSAVFAPILSGYADVVYGSRFMVRSVRRALQYRHFLINRTITTLSNLATDLYLTDAETCYKAFRLPLLKTIPLRSNRFDIEIEITAKIAKRQLRIFEVPINYYPRTHQEGKKIGWKDGFQALWCILKYWVLDDMYDPKQNPLTFALPSLIPACVKWHIDLARPFLGKRVLELEAKSGERTRHLIEEREVIAISPKSKYLKALFQNSENIEVKESLVDEPLANIDSIFYDSESIDDELIEQSYQILSDTGTFVLIVPSQNREHVMEHLKTCHFKVKQTQPFNKTTQLFSSLMSQQDTGHYHRWQLKILNTILPVFRHIDHLLPVQASSLLIVATK